MDRPHWVRPLAPIRKIIAARMVEAKRTIPHFRLVADVEVDSLIRVQRSLRQLRPQSHLSLTALLVKACATALMDVPDVNIQWSDGGIKQYQVADISMVIGLEDGLSTPVIWSADSKSVWDIERDVRDLASRAGNHSLRMEEIMGGSFSISNLGMYDVHQFDAVINPPQCAILAIGTAKPQVIVTKTRESAIATLMRLTLSVDHRAIDGIVAAKFMAALRHRLEQPDYLSEWIGH